MGLRDRVELAHEEHVLRGLDIRVRQVLQDFQHRSPCLRLVLLRLLQDLSLALPLHQLVHIHVIV